ncbi:metal ABC transporter permease [Rhodanobacter sp. MP1X3]|uniref:metal ABC transporter permease n=1 Tax=Rhodanobacter sp. MP1X3 TaxID=2723086 RepID=UPI00160AAC81|nr:metal ABC transporter permease [Rhodanobacter sp. MP1X3]MBB6242925.1 hypothetical protein [Rhodanobacter sp. MP1X3]
MNMITLKRKAMLIAMATGLSVVAIVPAVAADQPATPVHIRGTVLDVSSTGFTVQTSTGPQIIAIAAETRVTGIVPSSLDAIKAGTFIGTANVPGASGARALEVVVFPDAMKGTGLGDYAWDLPAKGGTASAMTNGTVKKMNHGGTMSAMTNGTVKTSSGSGARTLVVDYGKGEKTINVPANVPVVTFQPVDKTAIVKGAHVFVVGKPGSPVNAGLVAVGLNGTVPPM